MSLSEQDVRDYYKQQAENSRTGKSFSQTPHIDAYIKKCKDAGKNESQREKGKF